MNLKSILKAGSHLLKTYFTAMPNIVYRSTISLLTNPKGTQRFIHQVLNTRDLESDDPVLGSADITDVIGDNEVDVQIIGPYYSRRSSDTRLLLELASLAYLCRALKPRIVFEIGTFVGRTTRLLSVNSPPDCNVLTLDLEPDLVEHKIGEAFKETPENDRITQLYGDSREFDFSPWCNKCNFVWVDACHDYDHVVNDTQKALKLCRPGGWIGWHDYRHTAWWSGVTRCARNLYREYPGLIHIKGTTIVLLKKP